VDADVLALQEVENLDAPRRFNRDHLDRPYAYEALVEGNDPRFIDVAVLSRLPIANLTSHRFEVHPDDPTTPVFGRAWNAGSVGVGSDHDPAWVQLSGL
jgi:endonuclease/exonuclease/phosphatase family metal-dependent hydrolase